MMMTVMTTMKMSNLALVLGCQLLSNYSEVTVITVFCSSDFGYCLF